MQSVKYRVGPVESTRGKTSPVSLLLECPVLFSQGYSKVRLKELIFGHLTELRQRHWPISVKLEDLWVSLCPIKRFDLYALDKIHIAFLD